ncbi:MAG: thioesterase family protein [Gemmatimonadota bacterium]
MTGPALSTSVEVRVRYGEADRMGFAYHAHYLHWCDIGRTEHLRRHGVRYRDLEDRGFLLAVAEVSLRFLKPARYDDLVRVTSWVTEVGSRRVNFEYRMERADDGALLATAMTALVSIGPTGRPTRLPDDLLILMRGVLVGDA